MVALIIASLLFVIGPAVTRFLPLTVRKGRTAHNNAVFIILPPPEVTLSQSQSPHGRMAQEVVDSVHRWVVVVTVGWLAYIIGGGSFTLPADSVGWMIELGAFVLMTAAAAVWPVFAHVHFDAVGHEVEILVAERVRDYVDAGRDGYSYREKETNRVKRQAHFTKRGYTFSDTNRILRGRSWLAEIFIAFLKHGRLHHPNL